MTVTPGLPDPPVERKRGFAEEASGVIGLVFGLGLTGILLAARSDEPGASIERTLASLAFGALVTLPGILALLGRKRPALYLAAAVLGFPMMFVSFSGLGFPLALPAVLSLIAYGRRSADSIPRMAAPVIALMALVLGMTAFFVLLLHEDPRSTVTANTSTYASDVVSTPEALASIAVSIVMIALLWTLARPRRNEPSLTAPAIVPQEQLGRD